MSTKLACPVVPAIEICPNCKSEMIVAQVMPTFLADGFVDVIYRCKGCHSDVKRMFKQRLGTWELVTGQPSKMRACAPKAIRDDAEH